MRRQPEHDYFRPGLGRFEVTIKAPTLGLMTRIPSDQPDPRYAAAASNVRFDDGVVRNAPGCAAVIGPTPDSPVNLIFPCNVTPTGGAQKVTGVLICTAKKLYALLNASETVFPIIESQVAIHCPEITSRDMLRKMVTMDKDSPRRVSISIGDDFEIWKLRPRAAFEDDDGESFLLPIDYGIVSNNRIWVRTG